jgi:spermidine/putrescine transport system permease protein
MKERTTGLPRSLPWWLHRHGAISAAFLLLPVLTLIAFSFSRSPSALKWGGFTFQWYLQLAGNERLLRAAENSAIIAAAATAIGLLLGIPAAIGHARLHRSRHTVAATLTLPLMAPDIVAALSLKLWCVTLFSMAPGLPPMILGHSLLAIAYTFLLVSSRLQRFDWNLTDAARDLGASPWATFQHILFPHLWPSIAGAALLSFGVSLDEYVISNVLAGPGSSTVPIETASMIRKSFTPEINALAVCLLVLSTSLALAALRLQQRK